MVVILMYFLQANVWRLHDLYTPFGEDKPLKTGEGTWLGISESHTHTGQPVARFIWLISVCVSPSPLREVLQGARRPGRFRKEEKERALGAAGLLELVHWHM